MKPLAGLAHSSRGVPILAQASDVPPHNSQHAMCAGIGTHIELA